MHCALVLSLREQTQIDVRAALGAPQTQIVDSLRARARYHNIVRNGYYLIVIVVSNGQAVALPALGDNAAEADREGLICTGNQPSVAALKPHIGQLDLISVNYLLLKQTVFIEN